jgi:hypothetical protein
MDDFTYHGWRSRGEKIPLTDHHTLISSQSWMDLRNALWELRDNLGQHVLHEIEPVYGIIAGRYHYIGLVVGNITFWTDGYFDHTPTGEVIDLSRTKIDTIRTVTSI